MWLKSPMWISWTGFWWTEMFISYHQVFGYSVNYYLVKMAINSVNQLILTKKSGPRHSLLEIHYFSYKWLFMVHICLLTYNAYSNF